MRMILAATAAIVLVAALTGCIKISVEVGAPAPTNTPTAAPTATPTATPTKAPTNTSTVAPTNTPANTPTNTPANTPTSTPTATPTATPTNMPTVAPTKAATRRPTATPVPPTAVPAATLIFPDFGARVDGKTTFSWTGGPLAPGQAWEVQFSRGGGEFLGVAPPTTNNYLEVDLTVMPSGNYQWRVAVVGTSPYRVISIPATSASFEISEVIPVPSG